MARREKKSKINLKIWLPIICIIVVGVAFYMMHDIKNKIAQNENITNKEQDMQTNQNEIENIMEENVIDEQNVIEESNNQIIENTVENASPVQNSVLKNSTTQSNGVGITDKKQKAIELVKKQWGEDDTVDYVFDYVNENGEYVIAVKDRNTATMKCYYRVNLETETIELD